MVIQQIFLLASNTMQDWIGPKSESENRTQKTGPTDWCLWTQHHAQNTHGSWMKFRGGGLNSVGWTPNFHLYDSTLRLGLLWTTASILSTTSGVSSGMTSRAFMFSTICSCGLPNGSEYSLLHCLQKSRSSEEHRSSENAPGFLWWLQWSRMRRWGLTRTKQWRVELTKRRVQRR